MEHCSYCLHLTTQTGQLYVARAAAALASDDYIQQHNKQQEAEKQKTTHAGAQVAPVMVGSVPLRRPRMAGLYDLPPPPPQRMDEHNTLNEDQALKMTADNVCFIEFF